MLSSLIGRRVLRYDDLWQLPRVWGAEKGIRMFKSGRNEGIVTRNGQPYKREEIWIHNGRRLEIINAYYDMDGQFRGARGGSMVMRR